LHVKLKKDYFQSKINEAGKDSKMLWSTLRKVLPNKTDLSCINSIVDNGELLNNPEDIANSFNSYFANIGASLASVFPPTDKDQDDSAKPANRFRFSNVSADEIYKQLSRMPSGKATGLDDISPRLLKAGARHISQPIAYIMNLGLQRGVVPDKWKQSRVTPIFKDGDRSATCNYRPISVIPAIMKVYESVIHQQFYKYI